MTVVDLRRRHARLVWRQLYYEQLSFWRNPFAAFFTIGFSLVFLVLLSATGGAHKIMYDHVTVIQFYMPRFAAYGVMSACFSTLAIQLVNRRETGLLKRLRLSPLPTWAMIGALVLNALVVSVVQVVVLLLVGRFAFGARFPADWGPLVVAVAVGVVCFTALGIATSAVVPNQDAAGPIVSIVFFVMLFVSGLWFHLTPHSGLAQFSKYFPIKPLMTATSAPFQASGGASPWEWGDLSVVAIWGAASVVVAARRFRFEPRRGQ
jgi:ABC-2 type transport system permease protein